MIQPSKYNGINFSGDFNRSSEKYNFGAQRVKNVLPKADFKYLSFEVANIMEGFGNASMYINGVSIPSIQITSELKTGNTYIFYVQLLAADLPLDETIIFKFVVDSEFIYSEIYEIKSTTFLLQNEVCKIISSNNDNRHGYLANQIFGFFKFSKLKSDIFLNKKTEYNYSYSRKKILSSENQIGKRFTFLDLTMYQANLLKWLCNCENLSIDGTSYQLISDFTELESDPNSEIINLQADFVETNQSFFANSTSDIPTNIFTNQFFN